MTEEELVKRISGGCDELISLLWERVSGHYRRLSIRFYNDHRTRCQVAGVTVDDLHQESFFAMLDSVRAYSRRQQEFSFLSFTGYPFQNHAMELIGLRTRTQREEPLNTLTAGLDAPLPNEGGTLQDIQPDPEAEKPFREFETADLCRAVREAVRDTLDSRSAEIIKGLYFEDLTLSEVGEQQGLSGESVRIIRDKAFAKLRRTQLLRELADRPAYYRHVSITEFQRCGSSVERLAEQRINIRKKYDRYHKPKG